MMPAELLWTLGIPYYVMNFKNEFQHPGHGLFCCGIYGRTYPKSMYRLQPLCEMGISACSRSLDIGADYIATGHYARIEQLPNGRYAIKKSVTAAKDQTYALYNLTQEQLSHTLMPVGNYHKDEIRDMAQKLGLPVASQAGQPGNLLYPGP